MNIIPLVMLITGGILIWAAITDRNPIDVAKAVVQREDIPPAGSLSGNTQGNTGGGGSTERGNSGGSDQGGIVEL